MAIPKVGSRKITVDGIGYRWLIRRQATNFQADYGHGRLHVAVELAEKPGTTLVLLTDRPHPQDIETSHIIPVTPGNVAFWVGEAIRLGWKPAACGGPVMFMVKGNALEQRLPSNRPRSTCV
jgi:hypothetical protein